MDSEDPQGLVLKSPTTGWSHAHRRRLSLCKGSACLSLVLRQSLSRWDLLLGVPHLIFTLCTASSGPIPVPISVEFGVFLFCFVSIWDIATWYIVILCKAQWSSCLNIPSAEVQASYDLNVVLLKPAYTVSSPEDRAQDLHIICTCVHVSRIPYASPEHP